MLQLMNSNRELVPETTSLIAERIRGEFREMPGLALTPGQACRLWSIDLRTCQSTLTQLVESGFLYRRADGTYGRASDLVRTPVAMSGLELTELESPRASS